MALRLLRGAPRAAKSSLLCSSLRSTSSKTGGRSEPAKQSLKKPKLPVGRFDEPEESSIEREPLEKFPDGVNPVTKERVDLEALNLHVSEIGREKDVV